MKPNIRSGMEGKWVVVALANFAVAATMGLLLRASALMDMPWLHFRHMTHAHSHAAMMGWLYLAVFALILHLFVPIAERKQKTYERLFLLLQTAVIGMMLSFPFQGYGAVSISFSALHLFGSYAFLVQVWKHARSDDAQPLVMLRTAIVLMMFSTLGVYALGPVTAKFGRMTDAYHLCIQFFLHFQFQGWFLFAIGALLLQRLLQNGVCMPHSLFRPMYLLLLVAVFGMMALPTAQYGHLPQLLGLNMLGSLAQLGAVAVLIRFLSGIRHRLGHQAFWVRTCGWIAVVSLVLKVVGQAILSWPEIALMPVKIRPMVVGFVHLLVLGSITAYLLMELTREQFFFFGSEHFRVGIALLFSGLLLTEIPLFTQATTIWTGKGAWPFYDVCLFSGSVLLWVGVTGLLLSALKGSHSTVQT